MNDKTSADQIFSDKQVVALTAAAERGDVATIDALIRDGVKVNARGQCNNTPLLRCFYAKNWEGYRALLRHNADPNVLDDGGAAVILLAATEDDPKWLREALGHGGNPNLVNAGNPYWPNRTPLFYAIGQNLATGVDRIENVRLLLAAGANPNFQDGSKKSAFYKAVEDMDYEKAGAMLEAGADMHLKTAEGRDAVDCLRHRIDTGAAYAVDEDTKKWLSKLIPLMNAKGAKLDDKPPK